MGLASKKNVGVKSQLRTRFPSAFRDFNNLVDARDASSATRQQTFACVDGNVLMMAVPMGAKTMDAFVAIITNSIKATLATTAVTVVVFDDPGSLTLAKTQEQMRRDAHRASTAVQCSSDLVTIPKNDDYTCEDIAKVPDVQALIRNRPTRSRFIDEICRVVMERLQRQIDEWKASGYDGGHVIFDGVDARGATRPMGEPRQPSIVATSEEARAAFDRETVIGEGDLKLAYLGRSVRLGAALGTGILKDLRLSLCTTIDTDSFAIELIEEARRSSDAKVSPVNTLICMRERASKRGRDDDHDAYYLCCDVALLHAQLQRHMWGISQVPSPRDQRAAMTLLVAGWAVCGCDFVPEVNPMRSDVVFDAIGEVVRRHPESLEIMEHAWLGKRDNMVLLHGPIRQLLLACASRLGDLPRVKAQNLSNLRNIDVSVLRRASWVSAYWNSVEYRGNLDDFGFYVPYG